MSRTSSVGPLASRFRGLYHRVAQKLGVDASYVSRVARGERFSEEISAALEAEVRSLLGLRPNRNAPVRELKNQLVEHNGVLLTALLDSAWLLFESASLSSERFDRRRNVDKALRCYQIARPLSRTLQLSDPDRSEIERKLQFFAAAVRQFRSKSKSADASFLECPEQTRKVASSS